MIKLQDSDDPQKSPVGYVLPSIIIELRRISDSYKKGHALDEADPFTSHDLLLRIREI